MTWQTDRSRYMAGWSCEWRRLLGYHAFGTGLSPSTISTPLATGIYAHNALELLLAARSRTDGPMGKAETATAIAPALAAYRQYAASGMEPTIFQQQSTLVEGLAHAYSRIVLPWMHEQFEVISIEQEETLQLNTLEWMARPDFVTKHRETGALAVHDFKTSSSWSEQRDVGEYQDSVQMMMNAAAVSQRLDAPVSYYYIHILLKGNDYAPSPLVYPYIRPGNPPISKHDLQAYYKYTRTDGSTGYLGRTYQRTPVWEAMPVADWVWQMHQSDCAKQIILIGPYDVRPQKMNRFRRGMVASEMHWQERLQGVDWSRWGEPEFQNELDSLFPRTYQCYTYGTRCAFYPLCHQHEGWENPASAFEPRTPHHTTEEV